MVFSADHLLLEQSRTRSGTAYSESMFKCPGFSLVTAAQVAIAEENSEELDFERAAYGSKRTRAQADIDSVHEDTTQHSDNLNSIYDKGVKR